MTNATTTTQNTTPYTAELETVNDVKIQRMNSEHYKMLSFSVDRIYDIKFNHENKRWECNCPDTRYNKNFLCKHVTLLRVWIRAAEAEAAAKEANTRADTAETAAQEEQTARESLSSQIASLAFSLEKIADRDGNAIQEIMLENIAMRDTMRIMSETIEKMQQEREQASALIQASAQLIQAMQQSQSQQAPQITISIDGDANVKKAAAASNTKTAVKKPTIEKITLPNGNAAYKVDKKYTVRTDKGGKFSLSCDCNKGSSGKICEHGKAVDLLLGAPVDENEL